MTKEEAFAKAKDYLKEDVVPRITREFDNYFGFYVVPNGTPEGQKVFVGGEMVCVNKKTGKVLMSDGIPEDELVMTYRPR